jgi:CRISPR-associated protein Cas5h
MNYEKIISFDICADMGFFKKPDINEKIYLTYNILHRPAVLGILGAIAGLKGYEKNNVFPCYYNDLKHLRVGIEPLNHSTGNYTKFTTTYNNTTGFASSEDGGNLMITEQTLLKPAFRCFILLNRENPVENTLFENIKKQHAVFIPYLGKNDYSAWWNKEDVREYEVKKFDFDSNFTIKTIFLKQNPLIQQVVIKKFSFSLSNSAKVGSFFYFERLPIGFNERLYQYELGEFAYTDYLIAKDSEIDNLFQISESETIQLN